LHTCGDQTLAPRYFLANPIQCGTRDVVRPGDYQAEVAVAQPKPGGRIRTQKLRGRSLQRVPVTLEPQQPPGTQRLGSRLDLVHPLPAHRATTGYSDPADPAARFDRRPGDAELSRTEQVGNVEQLETVAQVGFVGPVALHRIGIAHTRER